jgi:hypothetical protein
MKVYRMNLRRGLCISACSKGPYISIIATFSCFLAFFLYFFNLFLFYLSAFKMLCYISSTIMVVLLLYRE